MTFLVFSQMAPIVLNFFQVFEKHRSAEVAAPLDITCALFGPLNSRLRLEVVHSRKAEP